MKKTLNKCPICSGDLVVTEYSCKKCGTKLQGKFENNINENILSDTEYKFMTDFVRCRGSIKEMEKLYNISYPTVKKNLDSVVVKLGGPISIDNYEKDILSKVKRKEMTVEEAIEALKNHE